MLNPGDWVVYECGSKREIGRVWKVYEDRCSVCYHQGCTAAMTPISMLRPYDRDKDEDIVPDARIGYHRFDRYCPEYDRTVCGDCGGRDENGWLL